MNFALRELGATRDHERINGSGQLPQGVLKRRKGKLDFTLSPSAAVLSLLCSRETAQDALLLCLGFKFCRFKSHSVSLPLTKVIPVL